MLLNGISCLGSIVFQEIFLLFLQRRVPLDCSEPEPLGESARGDDWGVRAAVLSTAWGLGGLLPAWWATSDPQRPGGTS